MRSNSGSSWQRLRLKLWANIPTYVELAGAKGASAFQRDFRESGLRWLLYASFAGFVASLAFLGIDSLTLAESNVVTLLRALIACVLLVFGFCTVQFRAWVLEHYDSFVSVVLCVVLLGVVGIVGTPGVVAVGDGFSVGPMLVFCLFLIYGFIRLPLLLLFPVCCLFTACVLVSEGRWSEGPAFHRLLLYAVLSNVLGVLLAFFIVQREYLLFKERENLKLSREGLRQRAVALQLSRDDMRRLMRAVDHDLKQPLLAADFAINALRKALFMKDPTLGLEQLSELTKVVSFLRSSAEDVLSLAALEDSVSAELGPVHLELVVHDVFAICSPLARNERVVLSSKVSAGAVVAYTNRAVISRVLLNLVVNAIKFTASTGCAQGKVLLVARRSGEVVRLGVYDQGPGIEGGDQERIWEPFFRVGSSTGVDGSGLGLYLVSRMVRGLPGHSLELRSTVGKGSYFGVNIPSFRPGVSGAAGVRAGYEDERIVGAFVIVFTHSESVVGRVRDVLSDMGADVDIAIGPGSLVAVVDQAERMVDCVVFVSGGVASGDGLEEVYEFRRLTDGHFPLGLIGAGSLSPSNQDAFGDKNLDIAVQSFREDLGRLVSSGVARNLEIESRL